MPMVALAFLRSRRQGRLSAVAALVAPQGERPPELWSVIIPLWTGAEGRSDLLLEATVEDRVEGPVVEVRSVHVL
jgi:hypothetical protein